MQIHVGEKIYEVFKEKGWTIDFFARKVHMTPRNIQYLFKRSSIDIIQLSEISKAMQYDFVKLYVQQDEGSRFEDVERATYPRIRKESLSMNISLNLSGEPNQYNKLPDLIKKIRNAAEQLGFQVN